MLPSAECSGKTVAAAAGTDLMLCYACVEAFFLAAAAAAATIAAVAAVAAAAAAAVFRRKLSYLTNRYVGSASAIKERDKEVEGQVQIFTLLRCSIHISHDIS